ncbi:hypothetical protein MXL46_20680 [Heyndrickxia sporothermodurans]|uniref:hypothetical protein n=1 Tax=Bacilli TaxID=91061 RepID=UPI0012E2BFE4|nr:MULTISPECIES: hypothetical protein [Bacilli]MEB6551428.1 hypothetical protein [Heyndrickxia sporothermodurans]QGU39455.1 hypothetical protein F5989_00025 [Streptococcus mutans]
MKNKIFTIIIMSFITFVAVLPSISMAATNRWSFTMEFRVVDGSKNGQFMTLSKGTADFEGTHKISSSKQGAVGPNKVNYQLYNKTTGNSFGIITDTPSKTAHSFWGTFTGLGGGTKYYLFIWRGADDGHTISGSGTVK